MLNNHHLSKLTIIAHSLLVTTSIIAFFFYTFAVANRYHIFLYGHLGAIPFDVRTTSRYWMTGLVANGIVLLGYLLLNWFTARVFGVFNRKYVSPDWWQVWLWSALPIGIGIIWITTNLNVPTMPLSIALMCAGVALIGLAFALMPGSMVARQPMDVLALSITGWGLIPALLLFRFIELPAFGTLEPHIAYSVAIVGILLGALWLTIAVRALRRWHITATSRQILVAGLCWSYLFLPLVHFLFLTPIKYRYISVSDNFFAQSFSVQIASWGIAILSLWFVNRRSYI